MKHVLILFCLYLFATAGLQAQTASKSNPQPFTGAAAAQELPGPAGTYFHIQVGNGVPYGYAGHEGDTLSVRFPWDALYIPITFAEDYFEVSKGYYSDRVQIDWTVQNNANLIDRIVVYRRPYTGTYADDTQGYTNIATLAADAYTFNDTNIQGGKLYEYKIMAIGVSVIEEKYINHITGIGYRNPTAVVTGNISFDGGSPVKDVVVRADPQGADLSFGSSLLSTNASLLSIPLRDTELEDNITLQAWVKLQKNTSAFLFRLADPVRTSDKLEVMYATTGNSLTLTVSLTSAQTKSFSISEFYPTGNLDGKGDDLLNAFTDAAQTQTDFDQNFVHLSVVLKNGEEPLLYINGRNIDEDYPATLPENAVSVPSITTLGNFIFTGFHTADVTVADGLIGNIDEIRLWNTALTEKRIRTDFKRYLGGSEANLVSYLRCDEKAGSFAYDISKVGFEFNKNHAQIINATWSANKPTSSQLGILGVTDELGNYIISAIPYSGTGESYTLTPMFGVHQFEPSQQLVFIGNGSEVINKIDFKDISAFDFMGVVYYTTTGVFEPLETVADVTSVTEDGYNEYSAIIDGNEQLISKGAYHYDKVNEVLYETPTVFVPGANIYIDGDIVLDKNKRPAVTDQQGFFKIKVPIGEHYIEVRKDKHGFAHAGRFPAEREDGDDLFEFFEHQQSAVTFLDTTRVTLVGRVVGGTREAEKPIGFGYAGPYQYSFGRADKPDSLVTVSSVNNIGIASITLTYLPPGGTPGGELEYNFETDSLTGEYKVSVLPLSYTLEQTNGVRIKNNSEIELLTANEILNLSKVPDTLNSGYKDGSGVLREISGSYHFVKNIIYRSTPTLAVLKQNSLETIIVKDAQGEDIPISTDGFQHRVYKQFDPYFITFQTKETYTNYDGDEYRTDEVPIADGEFNITNNLALTGTESLTINPDDKSLSTYKFQAGVPAIAPPFTRTIDIRYRVGGVDYQAVGYNPTGVILGGRSDGSQTFVTDAIAFPDIILRDPPGSNSFASIEKGSSITVTQSASQGAGVTSENSLLIRGGMKVSTFGFFGAPVVETENLNNVTAGLSVQYSSTDGESLSKTYTFNETIATSNDPLNVGSDADLYIGNSKNFFYGTFDNVEARREAADTDYLQLTNATGESIYINKRKGFIFKEEPSNTFFVFSQKHIIETLIPELQAIVDGLENGTIPSSGPGTPPFSKAHYEEQIRQWRWVIQENERTKYQAIYDRAAFKTAARLKLTREIDSVGSFLNSLQADSETNNLLTDREALLKHKYEKLSQMLNVLDAGFEQNVSFDAGAGEYTRSVETAVVQGNSRTLNLALDPSIETNLGFTIMSAGIIWNSTLTQNNTIDAAVNSEASETFKVNFTLQDNDIGNFLSVDVLNAFDGNGPVFSTLGGRTSCPYEGLDTTLFFNQADYQAATSVDKGKKVFSGGEKISYATQQIQKPKISVKVANVTDVPEAEAAEFMLILENTSPVGATDGPNAYFDIWVDNTTNPYNAIMNVGTTGTSSNLFVPYGKQTEYLLTLQKSGSDVYEYKDIDVYLLSSCESSVVFDYTTISATFSPSCTGVQIEQPLENWVVNAGDAFNTDNTTNAMNISMLGYNRAFASFENFRLEYRKATSSSWTRLKTYYNTQALLDEAVLEGEDNGALITANQTTFPLDIGTMGLADGQYEIRAVSTCANGTTFISDVVPGTVDLNVPMQFGTPAPTDGILGPGEDLHLQFNENILHNSAISKIQIQGETNQQEIDHNVTIHFEGAANTAIIEKPNILPGDFSIEFWMQHLASGSGVLFHQNDSFRVVINNGVMEWTFGNEMIPGAIAADGLFHHYTLTFNEENKTLKIYEDDHELSVQQNANGLPLRRPHPLVIGGNTFVGNLHDLRFWSKPLTLSEAYAAMFNELIGSERDLVGYWPMNEGAGTYASDLARFKHAALTAEWDIKPKGTAYDFTNDQYLELDDVDFVQVTDLMDVTLEFWIKTTQTQKATIFSNGRGNGEDLIQSNGKANKWAVSIENGILYLDSEGIRYKLSESSLADNTWHHVAIVLRRTGTLRTFIDAAQESSSPVVNIGGLSGNKFWIGARGFINSDLQETIDEKFTGKIDELRLWNTARVIEQISRDRYNEVDFNAIGLMLYARMNQPDPVTGNGPQYYHAAQNETVLPSNAVMSAGGVSYTTDAPKIKQVRPYLTFQVSHVINDDEMILTPLVSDWSVLEGQILDITVDRMFDVHGNRQASPITWTAYVRRNEVAWFANDNQQTVDIVKSVGSTHSFTVTLLNKGGKKQPYAIENIPSWMKATNTSGTLDPNSSKIITFSIARELTIGEYTQDLYLNTDFNFDEKIVLNLRVLGEAPEWTVDPSAYEYSMNIIGKVKLNGIFSNDPYTKIAAFAEQQIRGVANLEYDENYDEHFVYLNIFGNGSSADTITFKVWDATTGKVYQATMNGEVSLVFIQNEIIGMKSAPMIFENTSYIEQRIPLNAGWTWISLYAEDKNLDDLNALTSSLTLADNDLIKSQLYFDVYDHGAGWNGTLSNSGGLNTSSMYKVRLAHANTLVIGGDETNLNTWRAHIQAGWNWLAYPLSTNVSVNDALAPFQASEGDVIKTQRSFAIYDPVVGWSGTLSYLLAGEGFMLKAGISQEFRYPDIFSSSQGRIKHEIQATVDGWKSYEHNMNVIAEVVTEEKYDSVFVIDRQGIIRGKSALVEQSGRSLSYITVFGNSQSDEMLYFSLSNTKGTVPANSNIRFSPDLVMGTVKEPLRLTVSSENEMTVFPNVFSQELNLQFIAQQEQETEINMVDRVGRKVYTTPVSIGKGYNRIEARPEVPGGLYILSIVVDGQKRTFKVIKR